MDNQFTTDRQRLDVSCKEVYYFTTRIKRKTVIVAATFNVLLN